MCPNAKLRSIQEDVPQVLTCNVVLDIPISKWVLWQHPQDKKGTIAGRASTDIFIRDKCAQCYGFVVDPETKEIVARRGYKWLYEDAFELPEDFDPAEHAGIFELKDWPKKLIVNPRQFPSEDESHKHHPVLEIGRFYHIKDFHSYSVEYEDIWLPGKYQTYAQYLEAKLEAEI